MRKRLWLLPLVLLATAVLPAVGQSTGKLPIELDFDENSGVEQERTADGQGLRFTVKFGILRHGGTTKRYQVVVDEDGREVARFDVPERKPAEGLSTVLAIDISGSKDRTSGEKNAERRIAQSKKAATVFLDRLPQNADCGLILFDHQVLKDDTYAPTSDRKPLHLLINNMQPRGGTAYLDAAKEAITMLSSNKRHQDRKKVVVLMTDGIDLNSKAKLDEVIKDANKKKVSIYPIGIGEPGKLENVTSVLVLDRSASMEEPADDKDPRSKIVALREAAAKFVSTLPKQASTTVLPFGSSLGTAKDFTKNAGDIQALIQEIKGLTTEGETKMLDAAYEAIAMLAVQKSLDTAAKKPGKYAIVVMTDGIDNVSRLRPEDVIAKAKQAGVTVHMLLFGKEEELVQAIPDMKLIAKETGGTFNHAKNEKALIRIFEDMSIALHDDGIDEPSLKRLASETGGVYYQARDISKLQLIAEQILQQLPKEEYIKTFNSPRGFDGTKRKLKVRLVQVVMGSGGQIVHEQTVQEKKAETAVRGVVVAEMHPVVYLGLFSVLVLMATIPPTLGRMFRSGVSSS
jgi:Mg-chelatase subunit ChlD